jgi:hypothetical protein
MPVGPAHSLVGDVEMQFGVCDTCGVIHLAIESMCWSADLQVTDTASARAIAQDLLAAADEIESRAKPERQLPRLTLVEN